jgi:PKD repeat protein
MPEIHTVGEARYYWNQWNDGNTSRSRTVIITENMTLTAYYTGPYYELAVDSSPIAGISFTINGNPQTTPYSEWLLEDSYTLIMPETHNEYVWSHWLEDSDSSRTKTITLTGSTTLTGVFGFAVPPYGPTAEFTATPETTYIGESVKFDASSSQPGWNGTHTISITEYRWDFGDGNKTTTATPIVYHSFTDSKYYYVELTVYSPGTTPETDTVVHKVTIVTVPVGGYSIPINTLAKAKPLTLDLFIPAILASIFITVIRRKRCRKKD